MRIRNLTIWTMVGVLYLVSSQAKGTVEFKDGQPHDIDYEITESVWVDYQTPGMETTFNLLDRGTITSGLSGYEDSRINIYGGNIINAATLSLQQNSRVTVSGGFINDLHLSGNSQATVSGGSILGYLSAGGSSRATLSGGRVYGKFWLSTDGVLTIEGLDFAVDGQAFGYGELASLLGGESDAEPIRHLTGTLFSGDAVFNDFLIGQNGRIVLVPEPATFLLVGMGGLALIRKRRNHNSVMTDPGD